MRIHHADFPIADRLIGPGGTWEMEDRLFLGQPHRMFRHEPATLSAMIERAAAHAITQPDAPMTEHDGRITTYGDFFARSASLTDALRTWLGFSSGKCVAIAMGNRVEWLIALVGTVAAGGMPVLVNSRGAGEEMDRAIRMTGCSLVVADRERHAALSVSGASDWATIVLDPEASCDASFATVSAPGAAKVPRFAVSAPEDPALIMFSSGTTGFPKAIVHSQGGMAHAVSLGCMLNDAHDLAYEADFGHPVAPDERNNASTSVISSPLFHVNGFLPYLRTVVNGRLTVLMSRWNTDAVFDLLERGGVSRLGLVPTMVFDMLASPRAAAGGMARLRFLGSGTAQLDPAVARRMSAALPACLMYNGYGQSETGERVASFGGRDFAGALDAVGRVLPGTKIRIVREDGSDADTAENGEIVALCPSNMLGYHGDVAATADTMTDGWVRSGDIGHIDSNGFVHIVDRKKNMVISGGENIYCAEVERVLAEHPAVAEAFAYGVPDERLGERLLAMVVLAEQATLEEAELRDYATARLARYKVPRVLSFTRTPLPRTATGKVARATMLAGLTTE